MVLFVQFYWMKLLAAGSFAALQVEAISLNLRKQQPELAAFGGSWTGFEDMACFMELSRFGLKVGKDDIVFRSGHATANGDPEVIVVQDQTKETGAPRRILAFKSADGKCNPQACAVCAARSSDKLALLSGTSSRGMSTCSYAACTADVSATLTQPGTGYVRSMVGATAVLSNSAPGARQFLSIGLGAGTLALQLQQSFPGSRQTVVELSPDVAAAAGCFGASAASGLNVVVGDGREYLENAADGTYDAVFLDAFDASDKVPACFTTSEFFNVAKRKLKPAGILVMNAHSGKTLHNDVADLLPAANATFGAGQRLRIGTAPGVANAIVLAQAEGSQEASGAVLAQEASDAISAWFQDAAYGPVESSSVTTGKVLTDSDVRCSR